MSMGIRCFPFLKITIFPLGVNLTRTLCSLIVIMIEQYLEQWELLMKDMRIKMPYQGRSVKPLFLISKYTKSYIKGLILSWILFNIFFFGLFFVDGGIKVRCFISHNALSSVTWSGRQEWSLHNKQQPGICCHSQYCCLRSLSRLDSTTINKHSAVKGFLLDQTRALKNNKLIVGLLGFMGSPG